MSRADDIAQAVLSDTASAADLAEWSRLQVSDPQQCRTALVLLRVEGLLRAGGRAPSQAASVVAQIKATQDQRLRTSVMGQLHQIRRKRWHTTGSGRYVRTRPLRFWLVSAGAAGLLLTIGLAVVLLQFAFGGDPALPRLVTATSDVRVDGQIPKLPRVLLANQSVAVAAGGGAALTWNDGTTTTIDDAAFFTLSPGSADAGKRMTITRGRFSAVVAPQPAGRPLVFTTPHGEAIVVGTRLRLEVDDALTQLSVDSGLVRLVNAADGSVQDVAAGQRAFVAAPRRPLPPVESVQRAAMPNLDLVAQVRERASATLREPLLVAGEGADPAHHTLVRVFDQLGLGMTQFLAWPPQVRGGVAVATLRLADGTALIACAAHDASVNEIRLIDTAGVRVASWVPKGLKPPFAITTGRFIDDLMDEQVVITSHSGAGDLRICRLDGLTLATMPLPTSVARSGVTLATRRAAAGDRLLLGTGGAEPLVELDVRGVISGATNGVRGDSTVPAPLTASASERIATWMSRRWSGDHVQVLAQAQDLGRAVGLWQMGHPDDVVPLRLAQLVAGFHAAPEEFVGIMPGPVSDDARWRPGAQDFAKFLLRRYRNLEAINRHFRTPFRDAAEIDIPADRGRGRWDRTEVGNSLYVAWQHCLEMHQAELLMRGARDAILAGFPAEQVLLPASPRNTEGLPGRAGAASLLYPAGTGIALDVASEDLAAGDGLLAGALSSGHTQPVLWRIRTPLSPAAQATLVTTPLRLVPLATGIEPATELANAFQIRGAERHALTAARGRLIQWSGPTGPAHLVGVMDNGAWDGATRLTPFRTQVEVESLFGAADIGMTLEHDELVSPEIRGLGPGDQIELSFRAHSMHPHAALTVRIVRADQAPADATMQEVVELPDTRQVFHLGSEAAVFRYALRMQILTGPIRVVIHAGNSADAVTQRPRIRLESVQASVQRHGAALPDAGRRLGRPYVGDVSWDVFSRVR